MVRLTRVVLDVLKPHQPNSLEFARQLVETGKDQRVNILVREMDDKTHTLQILVEGTDIDIDAVEQAINDMGGSLHSVDEVQVENSEQ